MPKLDQLPRATPESQGISSSAILEFVQAVEEDRQELHGFMLLRHGAVVAEGWWSPYRAEYPHMLFSLSKSFTSTGIGLAVSEGRLTVDDPVISFFPEDTPAEVSQNLKAMRVRHLLSMSTGHAEDTTGRVAEFKDGNWVKGFLSLPVEFPPGTHFVYNSGASYMLSAIVQKVTGMKLLDYLQPRLFEPLGIRGATWETSPQGINMGGWGLNITSEDIARFGQMYLQKGLWNGKRILPETWVAEATSRQVSNGSKPESDWEQGYGYQFWRCRHGAYRGDGAFGQYCLVMPEQDAVLAVTSGLSDMQPPLNLVWKHLLPGMKPTSMPENAGAQKKLAKRLTGLAYQPPKSQPSSTQAKAISGKEYRFEANEEKIDRTRFDFTKERSTWTLWTGKGKVVFDLKNNAWIEAASELLSPEPRRMAASGGWTADDTYVISLRSVETPFSHTLTCKFTQDRLEVSPAVNVSFGPTDLTKWVGRAA